MPETQRGIGGAATITFSPERSADVRSALWLTYITIGWMTIEGVASLLLGWVSKSLLLETFGNASAVPDSSVGSRFKKIGDRALLRSGDVRAHPHVVDDDVPLRVAVRRRALR